MHIPITQLSSRAKEIEAVFGRGIIAQCGLAAAYEDDISDCCGIEHADGAI
jgi:hypothetical protein